MCNISKLHEQRKTMDEATNTIQSLVKNILPTKAHYLSLDATRRYRPHPDEKRLEEQAVRPLQYTTFVSDADRGVLLTRAYFSIREDNAISAPMPRSEPNKPKVKLSLKDYASKKRSPNGDSPSKTTAQPAKLDAPKEKEEPDKVPDPITKKMETHRDTKKSVPYVKPESRRSRSPSPGRRKRGAEAEQDPRPVKRNKVESAMSSLANSRSAKDGTLKKADRPTPLDKKPPKDPRSLPTVNGKSALSNSGNRDASPKPNSQVNGFQKSGASKDGVQKRENESTTNGKTSVPPLLSPINMSDFVDKDPRPSPRKKPADANNLKVPPKKPRDDREPSPTPRKRKIPPLLSPTLPPVIAEELAKELAKDAAKLNRTPLKDTNSKSGQVSDSPASQRTATKSSQGEKTIHVDNKKEEYRKEDYKVDRKKEDRQIEEYQKEEPKKEERKSLKVKLKYKKSIAKRIERLLALPPRRNKKTDALKKDERSVRDRSDSLEPSTARKRPPAVTANSEPAKRPKTSDTLRPSTPPRQSSAMARVASNSSQAGTPGIGNNSTPATQPPERRRPPVDLERVQKLQSRGSLFVTLGTKLKHQRDAIMKRPAEGDKVSVSDRDRQIAMASGIQSVVSYLYGFKLQGDGYDLERGSRPTRPLRELLLLFRVTRTDCAKDNVLLALVLRIQGICLVYLGRAMCTSPNDPESIKDIFPNCREQQEVWRLADIARRAIGVYDGSAKSDDGGSIGKLIDRLGPWTSPEEAIPVTVEILRRVIPANGSWKPAEALSRVGPFATNGVSV
ncbi:hypothetical protein F5B20DRAFT_297862 [Whalleya microplaca]|nr:hypothetical protein F5B20DRAFT_297862 [Whalleya microplaca]